MLLIIILILSHFNLNSYEVEETESATILSTVSPDYCTTPYELYLTNESSIVLGEGCLNRSHYCPFVTNTSCLWRIHNIPGNIVRITSIYGCLNPGDVLFVTECKNDPNRKIFINKQDVINGIEIVTGENEICVEFQLGTSSSDCGLTSWELRFSVLNHTVLMMLSLFPNKKNLALTSFVSSGTIDIKSENFEFEVWFLNSYNANFFTDKKEPLFSLYGNKNFTNFLGNFRKTDNLMCVKSSANNILVYVNIKNEYNGMLFFSPAQLWLRNPKIASKHCKNSKNFHFIHPTQQTFHIQQEARKAGSCEIHVVPALPSHILSNSVTLPTLCIANITLNSGNSLEIFTQETIKLFECKQEDCKYWNDTCVNGELITFVIPSNGKLEVDLYSLDDLSTKSFTFHKHGFGVLMSRNYPISLPFQNTTQQVFCSDGMAEFNLTFVDAAIPQNFTLLIKNSTDILYSFTNVNMSGGSVYFNSSQLIIEYGSNETNLSESIGFMIRYEGTSLNITAVNEPSKSKHILVIVLLCLGVTTIFGSVILGAYFGNRYIRKKKDSITKDVSISTINAPIRNLSLRLEPHINHVHESLIERLMSLKNINQLNFPNHSRTYEFDMEDFEELDLIDATTRNIVKKYQHKPTSIRMATKYIIIPKSSIEDYVVNTRLEKLLREIEHFQTLWQCSNIVDFYGFCIHEGHALLCMELMDFSLHHVYLYIHKIDKKLFPEDLVGSVGARLIDALIFCKEKNIIHRDIKPNNILLSYNGSIKLCDFGESRILQNSLASTQVGTIAYLPPERFINSNSKYDIRSDVWSLGITLLEVIMGRLPYLEDGIDINAELVILDFCRNITQTNFSEIIDKNINCNYSVELCHFLNVCTLPLENRPKLDLLRTYPFYQKYRKFPNDKVANMLANIKP